MKTSIIPEIKPSSSPSEVKILQNLLAPKVITKNGLLSKVQSVCGVDVSYRKGIAHGAAVILNKNSKEIVESVNSATKITAPYIPGYFLLRETKPILKTLKRLTKRFDVLLIDGNGQLHPRMCGLACYIGLLLDKPTIGVAKSLLCGKVCSDKRIRMDGKIIGYEIKRKDKKLYVSIGNKISLMRAVKIVEDLTIENNYPEPLRLADLFSKRKK